MNKQYMDFVPAGSTRRKVRENVARENDSYENTMRKNVVREKKPTVKPAQTIPTFTGRKTSSARKVNQNNYHGSGSMDQQFGVIEDLQPKFVETNVKKRPLGRKAETSIKQASSKRALGSTTKARSNANADAIFENALLEASELFNDDMPRKKENVPKKNPFVNTEKVEKRPLSGSVGRKKTIVAKEEPSEAVTIITKEKKDSKISIIVAVIITIILGATAGTVAFLLLPK